MVPAIHRGARVRQAPAALDGGIGPAVSASRPPTPRPLVEGAHGTCWSAAQLAGGDPAPTRRLLHYLQSR